MPQARSILRVSVKGIKRIARNLDVAEERLSKELGGALFLEGRKVIEEAALEVPKDTLALYRSRFVTPPTTGKGEIKVICGFGTDSVINPRTGRPTSQYAVYVHERLDLKHPVGKAKFLEDPVNRARPDLEERLARHVAPLIGR